MSASKVTDSRLATAIDVLAAYGHMAVIDSNDDFERKLVKLSQMSKRKKARNNCGVMSSQIVKSVTPANFAAVELKTVTIYDVHSAAFHSALLVTDDNGEYVADFTAAQFGKTVPFPFVADLESWKARIELETASNWSFDCTD